jgi:hypothetical protein
MLTGDSTTTVAREQFYGNVSSPTREHPIMEKAFSVLPVQDLYKEDQLPLREIPETAVRKLGLTVVKHTTVQMTRLPL